MAVVIASSNVIDGTGSNDRLYGTGGRDAISEGGIFNRPSDDRLSGGAGNDLLEGGNGNDRLYGGTGDDILIGGLGDDVMGGSAGRDVFTLFAGNLNDPTVLEETGGRDLAGDFRKGEDKIAVTLFEQPEFPGAQASSETLGFSAFDLNGNGVLDAGDGSAVTIEQVDFNGRTRLSTVLHVSDNPSPGAPYGNVPGELVLFGATGLSADDFVPAATKDDGGANADPNAPLFIGGYGDDLIVAADGSDSIADFGGRNFIFARDGDDVVTASGGGDLVDGGRGNDQLYGEGGDDVLIGGSGDDLLQGWTGDDRLYGGSGADDLQGNDGDDTLSGGKGDDRIFGGIGRNTLIGGAGDDMLDGLSNFVVDGSRHGSRNVMRGNVGDDRLVGGDIHEVVDSMFGDEGSDQLFTRGAQDYLRGGSGDDTFFADSSLRRVDATIVDFRHGDDKLDLTSFDPSGTRNPTSFAALDSNHDGILDSDDALVRVENVSFNGTARQSLEILAKDLDTNHYVPSITLLGITELHHADVVG